MLYLDLLLSIEATGFTPQDHVEIRVGLVTAKRYPKILPTMAVFEWVHAFQVNKTALTNLQANLRLVFNAFGGQLNATSTVNGIYCDWKRRFNNTGTILITELFFPFTTQQGIRLATQPYPATLKSCSPFRMGTLPIVKARTSALCTSSAPLTSPQGSTWSTTPPCQFFACPIILNFPSQLVQ
jgi:hypothetical protein